MDDSLMRSHSLFNTRHREDIYDPRESHNYENVLVLTEIVRAHLLSHGEGQTRVLLIDALRRADYSENKALIGANNLIGIANKAS